MGLAKAHPMQSVFWSERLGQLTEVSSQNSDFLILADMGNGLWTIPTEPLKWIWVFSALCKQLMLLRLLRQRFWLPGGSLTPLFLDKKTIYHVCELARALILPVIVHKLTSFNGQSCYRTAPCFCCTGLFSWHVHKLVTYICALHRACAGCDMVSALARQGRFTEPITFSFSIV